MNARVVHTMKSTLPADDTHPYRTGPWRPQTREWDAEPTLVHGAIPRDLDGMYLRNTENPLHPAIERYHPFDGDGLLHMIEFRNGRAAYRSRFVRTDGLRAETEAGRSLWAGLLEMPSDALREDGWGIRGRMKDASSTDVVVYRGEALTTFYFCGDVYRVDLSSGDTLGKADFDQHFPSWGVSAHPKVDPATGELLFFSYSKEEPYLRFGSLDAEGRFQRSVDVPLPGPRLPHDMAFTERFAIFNDFPLYWKPELLAMGAHVPKFDRKLPSRFALVDRRDPAAPIRWFEAAPTYVLHFTNAWDEGDEVVLEGFFQGCPRPSAHGAQSIEEAAFRSLALDTLETRLHRWRFNLVTGETREERVSETLTEFGRINPQFQSRPHRYVYAPTGEPGRFLFNGLVKHDVQSGREEALSFGAGVFASETIMAPRVGSRSEDDGYLVTFTMDMNEDASYCVILDASAPSKGPVCKLRLPERISSGTHAAWADRAALNAATMMR